MENLGISAIHPTAPEYLTAVGLFSAPIDVEAALARIGELWNVTINPQWVNVEAAQTGGLSGELLTFQAQGVQVMITPVTGQLQIEHGQLPEHHTHVAVTCFAPLGGLAAGTLAGEQELHGQFAAELMRRHRMVSAHIVYTQVADALMREPAAIGMYRDELGVIHPPQMVTELAESLTQGQPPLPLWINIRSGVGDAARTRTLGLPMFGHTDLEVVGVDHSAAETLAFTEATASYVVMGDAYLLPGQTIGDSDQDSYPVSQEISVADGATVMHIDY